MTPATPEHHDVRRPLQHASSIVDEESLHLLKDIDSRHEAAMGKPGYSSFDDTLSTSFMSSTGLDDLSDDEITGRTSPSSSTTIRISCISRIWYAYYDSLQRHPILVKSITAFVLLLLADLLAQGVENIRGIAHLYHLHDTAIEMTDDVMPSTSPINWLRALRFGIFGFLGAPWAHYYYHWLDLALPPTLNPWSWTTLIKVTIDQGIQAPVMLALIISGLAFMECRGWDGITTDMHQQYVDALIQNWKIWIPATVINIAFVKPALRVLYDNLVFFVWTVYLSMILNDG
jgi:peroxisomal membrane protein 2